MEIEITKTKELLRCEDKSHTIEINMDVKCSRCRKRGALKNGLCLECMNKGLVRGEFDHIIKPLTEEGQQILKGGQPKMEKIGDKTKGFINQCVRDLLNTYDHEINAAYIRADGKLSINFSVSIEPGKGEDNRVKVGINFVSERVKDEHEANIDEMQGKLFEAEKAA